MLGQANTLDPAQASWLAAYDEGIALYRSRRWAEAVALFERLRTEAPEDGPYSLYLRRSRALLAAPPPDDWNGVFVAAHK